MTYWDTSIILKLYVAEPDSTFWQGRAVAQGAPLRSSALAYAELAHALKQKEMRGEVAPNAARKLFSLFQEDLESGRYLLFPIGKDVLEEASDLAMKVGALRTLDGLHLASARLAKCSLLATADRRLAEAAGAVGMDLVQH